MKKFAIMMFVLMFMHGTAYSQSCLPEGITFTTQAQVDSFQSNYPGCAEIKGNVTINDAVYGNITQLDGLSVLTSIGGYLAINSNSVLASLTGLDNISSIELGLSIYDNDALINLAGLESLDKIEDHLFFSGNAMINLTGLEGLTEVEGSVFLGLNDRLTGLKGLESLTSIGGDLEIVYNGSLTSLTGIENINPGSIGDLDISNNGNLSTCDVKSICDYLVSPNGGVVITGNATGCMSAQEIKDACKTGLQENEESDVISIFPDPSSTTIIVKSDDTGRLSIYNLNGQQILSRQITEQQTVVDVSGLSQGVYFVNVSNDRTIEVAKFIKGR